MRPIAGPELEPVATEAGGHDHRPDADRGRSRRSASWRRGTVGRRPGLGPQRLGTPRARRRRAGPGPTDRARASGGPGPTTGPVLCSPTLMRPVGDGRPYSERGGPVDEARPRTDARLGLEVGDQLVGHRQGGQLDQAGEQLRRPGAGGHHHGTGLVHLVGGDDRSAVPERPHRLRPRRPSHRGPRRTAPVDQPARATSAPIQPPSGWWSTRPSSRPDRATAPRPRRPVSHSWRTPQAAERGRDVVELVVVPDVDRARDVQQLAPATRPPAPASRASPPGRAPRTRRDV